MQPGTEAAAASMVASFDANPDGLPGASSGLLVPGTGGAADATVTDCGERERETAYAELEGGGEGAIAGCAGRIHRAADRVRRDAREAQAPTVALGPAPRGGDPWRCARMSPHDPKRRAVDLEADCGGRVVPFCVDCELDEDQRRDLGTEHGTWRPPKRVDAEAGARRDPSASKLQDIVGRAPSAGFAPGDEPQRSSEHANPLRLGAGQSQRRIVDGVEQPGEQLIAVR